MNTQQFRSLVLEVLRAGDALQTAAIALQKMAVTMPYADFNDAAARIIGEKYGVEPHESRKGGTLTFAKDSAEEQRLKRIRRLHPDMVKGASNKAGEGVEIPAHIAALAAKLAAACNEYEGAKRLAAQAVAEAFAAK
jgi:hypothetical protein